MQRLIYSIPHHTTPSPLFVSDLRLHRSHGQNLAPLLPLQLGAHDTIDARSHRITSLVEQHASIVVESDNGSIAALDGVFRADDNGVAHVTALDLGRSRDAGHASG